MEPTNLIRKRGLRGITVLIISLFITQLTLAQGTYTQGDIVLVQGGVFQDHINDICETSVFSEYTIQITNSFMGDSVKVIGWGGQVIHAEENTSGQTTWQTNYYEPLYSVVFHEDLNGNTGTYLDFPTPAVKIISGTDTLSNSSFGFGAYVDIPDPCLFSTISGAVYKDNDGDCSYSSGDNVIVGVGPIFTINYSGTPGVTNLGYLHTNTSGYSKRIPTYIPGFTITGYTVSLPTTYDFAYSQDTDCNITSYSINSLPQANVDFALKCEDDIDTYILGQPRSVRPLMPFKIYPGVANIGCLPVSGQLKVIPDPEATFNPANSHQPDEISGDTLIWNYSNLNNLSGGGNLYFNQLIKSLQFTPSNNVNIGDFLTFTVITGVPEEDINPANNQKIITCPVVNSYDPNIKEVFPKGEGEEGYIPKETEDLSYTVHFQNTGNAPAINVYILDTISENLDINTFKILETSHQLQPEWVDDRVIKFNFQNINLADSLSDEPNSHGYVSYKIDLVPDLEPGTEIKNTAHIFFDANPAIVTNTTITTIEIPKDDEGTSGLISEENEHLSVYPNPTSGWVNFSFTKEQSGQLTLTSTTGQVVANLELQNETHVKLNTNELAKGIYFYQLTTQENEKLFGKLIVK